jgi:RNA polymerase sigma factor (sigma-70 family)
MTSAPTVFIVDDDPAVLTGLSRLLKSAGLAVAAFASAPAFLESDNCSKPGCLVLDVQMPGQTGIDLQQVLAERKCALPIIFLSGHSELPVGVRAMKLGAFDFLTKPVDAEALLDAVRLSIEKNRAARAQQSAMAEIEQRLATLTPREREVLSLVVAGQMNKQVAAQLGTVEKTVKVHRSRVMAKLQVRTFADLVHLADRAGIRRLDPPAH